MNLKTILGTRKILVNLSDDVVVISPRIFRGEVWEASI